MANEMMMWYVSLNKKNPKITDEHIKEAFEYFQNKYEREPHVAFVNPEQDVTDSEVAEVIRDKSVLKNHIYVAEDEKDIQPGEKEVTYRGYEEYT